MNKKQYKDIGEKTVKICDRNVTFSLDFIDEIGYNDAVSGVLWRFVTLMSFYPHKSVPDGKGAAECS
ncbi:MAG: hypothetical protein IJG87_00870 [Ruminococcus sp.]|nr:hypothetical protein [Ruminococcus sp.]